MSFRSNKLRFAKLNGAKLVEEQEFLKHIEQVQSRRKILQLALFLPDEILLLRGSASPAPYHFVGVLLCLDIFGVSDFIERHYNGEMGELYMMTVKLNAYVGSIIEVLRCYGGDVLSLFSNHFVAMWKCQPDESINGILHTVIVCANTLQTLLGTYQPDGKVELNLKTVISCGNVSYGIFGNFAVKRTVYIGDAFKSLRSLMAVTCFNKVVVSNTAYPHMTKDRYKVEQNSDGYVTVSKISYATNEGDIKRYFDEKNMYVTRLFREHYEHRDALTHLLQSSRLLANLKIRSKFLNSLPPRDGLKLCSHWTADEMQPFLNDIVFEHVSESQAGDYLTEMKEITCLYFKVVPASDNPTTLLPLVDEIFSVIVNSIQYMQCEVLHVYVMDSGIMIRIVFGLHISKREVETGTALHFAWDMKKLLEVKANVIDVTAGISSGNVFCCVIGHPMRKEYVIIGHPMLKARRLAAITQNKVLCDWKVFKSAKLSSLYFKLDKEEKDANGETDYFIEYNPTFDTTDEKPKDIKFLDRVSDFNLAVAMIKHPHTVGFSGICFSASEKLGKSMLLLHLREESVKHNCINVFVTLIRILSRPYYCITEIYRQIYDQIYTVHDDIENFLDLPRELVSFDESEDTNQDIVIPKYRTLNCFRDIVAYATNTIVVYIDNVHYIDELSWEILELTFPLDNLRLVMSCVEDKMSAQFEKKLQENVEIRTKRLLPLKDRYIGPLVCIMMSSEGASHHLIDLLRVTCEGNPGYVECLLLRFLNNGTIIQTLSDKSKFNISKYYYQNIEALKESTSFFFIVDFLPNKAVETAELSMDAIYKDHFDSMPQFLQVVVKTAAVIGSQFGRQLLRLTLNLPEETDLTETIKVLFDERIFECASIVISQLPHDPMKISCGCFFPETFVPFEGMSKYAHCKFMQFRNEGFRDLAYRQLPENQRHELHVMCIEILEKMAHICPSCVRNPSNYYAFFGHYDKFIEYCEDPSTTPNNYEYAKDSYENIKQAIKEHVTLHPKSISDERESRGVDVERDSVKKHNYIAMDEKFIPFRRQYAPSACYCLEMLHSIYEDLIGHSSHANEKGRLIFYKLKYGLNQMCMRDIAGAMKIFHETRELSLVDCDPKQDNLARIFRKYHVGKASIALAICNLKLRKVAAAKSNIMLALRQYNVPLVAFSYRHLRCLLRRQHLRIRTLRPYSKKKDIFGWELGSALFICAKVYALENSWGIANDCCKCGISLMKANNNSIAMLLDSYTDAMKIYSISGDNESCERLQKYLVREFQSHYAQNEVFSFHMLLELLNIVLEHKVAEGHLKQSICLGYRFINLADQSKVLRIKPSLLYLLCELNIYNLSFQNFTSLMIMLKRYLSPYHKNKYIYYYIMCMHCYNYTGFHVHEFNEVIEYAREYFKNSTHELTVNERTLKLSIQVHLLRCYRYDRASRWAAEMDYKKVVRSSLKVIKLMLLQMEVYLLMFHHSIIVRDNNLEDMLKVKIRELFELLKNAVENNLIYRPAYFGFMAWFLMLKQKYSKAKKRLSDMKTTAERCHNYYFVALAMRLKNHWGGGFLLEYPTRPHVSIRKAQSYDFRQFAQFLHSYVLA